MQKTIFILLDACQYEAGSRNLGFLEHMIDYRRGAKYKVKGELPSLSKPMYATLLTGLPAHMHGVGGNQVVKCLEYENVFSLCRAAGGVTAAAAFGWISELYNHAPFDMMRDRIQVQAGGNIDAGIYYWEDAYPDSHVFADGEFLRKKYRADFVMYHSMGIDNWGHIKGADSFEYERAVGVVSEIMACLLPQWLEEGYNVVVTADHGMNALGLHGGSDAVQRDVPLYIFSDKVVKGRFDDDYISQLNVAPLLCYLLGIEPAGGMMQTLQIRI